MATQLGTLPASTRLAQGTERLSGCLLSSFRADDETADDNPLRVPGGRNLIDEEYEPEGSRPCHFDAQQPTGEYVLNDEWLRNRSRMLCYVHDCCLPHGSFGPVEVQNTWLHSSAKSQSCLSSADCRGGQRVVIEHNRGVV